MRPIGGGVPAHDGEGDHQPGDEQAIAHDGRQDRARFIVRIRHDDRYLRDGVRKAFVLDPLLAHQDDEADADGQQTGEESKPPERRDDPGRPRNRHRFGKSPVIVPVCVLLIRNDDPFREIGEEHFAPLVLWRGVVFRGGHDVHHVVRHPPRGYHETDPAQDEDEQQFPGPQSPRRPDRLDQHVGTHDAQEKRDQQGEVDMGKSEVNVPDQEVARHRAQVHGDRQCDADHHGAWRRYAGGGSFDRIGHKR